MISLFDSFSIRTRPVTTPTSDNKLVSSFSAKILDKRPIKGAKEMFVSFSIGLTVDVVAINEARFIRVK